ncbi:MAG: DnaA/Hda family protein, partial [Nitrospirae bacterium]|nr:DnaA/Hda family protein [Nitrospirota bacterium]
MQATTKKEDIWNGVLENIEKTVGRGPYELWFKPVSLINIKDDIAILEIPNRFFRDWIEENYPTLIQDNIFEQTKTKVAVKYKIKEKGDITQQKIDTRQETRKARLAKRGIFLNPKHTFETFVVGASNQFAHAAALKAAESPGATYNPLFIYGGVGLGKTHLMNAIGNEIADRFKDKTIFYMPIEQFVNEVVFSLRHGKMEEFKDKHRNVDVLLVDDIQFIAGKERTQEEFFHTFNSLYEKQRQIVLS